MIYRGVASCFFVKLFFTVHVSTSTTPCLEKVSMCAEGVYVVIVMNMVRFEEEIFVIVTVELLNEGMYLTPKR